MTGITGLKALLLGHARIGPLLDLQEDRVLQDAKAVPAPHGNQDVADAKLARRDELAVLIVHIHLAAPSLHYQDLGRFDQVALHWQMHVPRDLTARRVDNLSHLEIALMGRKETCVRRLFQRVRDVGQDDSIRSEGLDHATP